MLKLVEIFALLMCSYSAANIPLIQNRTYASPMCTMDNSTITANKTHSAADKMQDMMSNATALDRACRSEVHEDYNNDTRTTVKTAARGNLNCTALNLYPTMQTFDVNVQNKTYSAKKTFFSDIQN